MKTLKTLLRILRASLLVPLAAVVAMALMGCDPVKTSGTGSGSYSNAKANTKPAKTLDQEKKKAGQMCFFPNTTTAGAKGVTLVCKRVEGNLKWVVKAKAKPIKSKFHNDSQPKQRTE